MHKGKLNHRCLSYRSSVSDASVFTMAWVMSEVPYKVSSLGLLTYFWYSIVEIVVALGGGLS